MAPAPVSRCQRHESVDIGEGRRMEGFASWNNPGLWRPNQPSNLPLLRSGTVVNVQQNPTGFLR